MKKPLLLAAALTMGALQAAPAHASGTVELAPAGSENLAVVPADKDTLPGFYLAGRLALSLRDFRSAAGFYAAALQKDPDNNEILDRSVRLDVASGNIARAAEFADDLLAVAPDDQLALLTLAVAELRAGDHEAAMERVGRLKALGGPLQELVATLLEAWSVTAGGQPAQAIRLLDDLSGPPWMNSFAKLHAGLIADRAGLHEIATNRLSLAYEQEPGDPRMVEAYARALARNGDTERATAVIDRFNAEHGGNNPVTDALRADIAAGDVVPLVESPREGIAEALYGLGYGIGSGDNILAASLLQLSLYLSPAADFPAVALGGVLQSLRQHEAAIDVYRAIDPAAPLRREAQMQEALNLNILKRHDEAKALLTSLLAEEEDDVQVAMALGNVHRSLEEFDDAGKIYTVAIDTFDTVPERLWTLYYYRGIALERSGDWPGAERDFRAALKLSPDHPLVLNYLGYSYIDRGENLDEAIDMVRLAVQKRPEDGYIVDSLGWAYYRLGNYDNAVRELERAVSLRPADPVINDHLGDAYWKVGRRLEARFQWSHARDLNPEPEELEKILKKLEGGLDAVQDAEKTAATEPEGEEAPTAQ